MRSPSFGQFVVREWRDLIASRAFWLMLLMIGPLVGHGFITAVGLYGEASGIGGGPAALPQGLTSLDGILVPTFGAYDLAATFLLPFVAIRAIAAEKQSGALKLSLQLPGTLATKVTAKGFVLLAGWLVALLPGLIAIALWKSYGGYVYRPETLNLIFGHLLRAMLACGIAVAAAAIAENAASAAIVTLGFTVGTWALDFVAAGRGGWLQQLAAYTPTAALRVFEHGLLQLNMTIAMPAIILAGFALAAIWLPTGRTWIFRVIGTATVAIALGGVLVVANGLRPSWDLSENRRNSFSVADEAVLREIRQPLRITVLLAPEDPRLSDLEQNVLRKLRRNLAHLDVDYTAGSRSGLFEASGDHYGEIWYEMSGQKIMERSTIDQVVLEQIYKLATVTPPAVSDDVFSGHPLAVRPRWASWIFYFGWPLAVILGWWLIRKR